jgi:hypothetical protein
MKAKEIAKAILTRHFTIGSLTWEEAIECSLITVDYFNSDLIDSKELKNEIIKIKQKDVYSQIVNKPVEIVSQQMELF